MCYDVQGEAAGGGVATDGGRGPPPHPAAAGAHGRRQGAAERPGLQQGGRHCAGRPAGTVTHVVSLNSQRYKHDLDLI